VALMRPSVLATALSVATDAVGPKDARLIGNWPRALQNGLVALSAEAGLTAVAPVRDRVVPTSASARTCDGYSWSSYWLLWVIVPMRLHGAHVGKFAEASAHKATVGGSGQNRPLLSQLHAIVRQISRR